MWYRIEKNYIESKFVLFFWYICVQFLKKSVWANKQIIYIMLLKFQQHQTFLKQCNKNSIRGKNNRSFSNQPLADMAHNSWSFLQNFSRNWDWSFRVLVQESQFQTLVFSAKNYAFFMYFHWWHFKITLKL